MDGWIQIHGWLASRPTGFRKKTKCRPPPADLFLEKSGRAAGQPTMYLASPIHFWGILLVLVYHWMYFPYRGWVVTFLFTISEQIFIISGKKWKICYGF